MYEIIRYVVYGHHSNYDEFETGDRPNVKEYFYAGKSIKKEEILDYFHKKYGKNSRYTCFWIESQTIMLVQEKPAEKNPL